MEVSAITAAAVGAHRCVGLVAKKLVAGGGKGNFTEVVTTLELCGRLPAKGECVCGGER